MKNKTTQKYRKNRLHELHHISVRTFLMKRKRDGRGRQLGRIMKNRLSNHPHRTRPKRPITYRSTFSTVTTKTVSIETKITMSKFHSSGLNSEEPDFLKSIRYPIETPFTPVSLAVPS